jgi:hypothetical protein
MHRLGDTPEQPGNGEPSAATLAWARETSREILAAQGYWSRHRAATPEEPADPAAEITTVLRQYDADVAAGRFSLPDIPAAPGTCTGCGLPTGDPGRDVCSYCAETAQETPVSRTIPAQPTQPEDARFIELYPGSGVFQIAPRAARSPLRFVLVFVLAAMCMRVFFYAMYIVYGWAVSGGHHP